ncbi:MAG TPA: TetR/AcrR family transcriptional regulator, partial [Trebonia sp.]
MTGKPGRPRSDQAHQALLAAARALVVRHGYDGVTVEMIASAAGTGRQTIYRHWPGKAELVLDAFVGHARAEVDEPPAAGSREQAVAGFLERTFLALGETGPALRSLMAHAQRDEGFRQLFRDRFIEVRRDSLRRLLRQQAGESAAPAETDVEAAVSALYGALWYRLLLGEPLDRAYARQLAALVVHGRRPPG